MYMTDFKMKNLKGKYLALIVTGLFLAGWTTPDFTKDSKPFFEDVEHIAVYAGIGLHSDDPEKYALEIKDKYSALSNANIQKAVKGILLSSLQADDKEVVQIYTPTYEGAFDQFPLLNSTRIVLRIRNHVVGSGWGTAFRIRDLLPIVSGKIDVPASTRCVGAPGHIGPYLPVHILKRGVDHRHMAIAQF